MSKIKKILCMLLVCAMVIVPCSVFGSVSAQTDDSEPLTVEVTTDKSSYTAYGIAEITVKVTNTSDDTVNNISAEAVFEQLAPVGKNNETFKEIESLQSGESFSFSYKATVNASKVKINFFEKIILWFVRLFNGGYTATSHNIEADTENITEIKFGKFVAENVVKIGYDIQIFTDEEIKQMDEVDNAIDNFLDNEQLNNLNESERINAIIDFLLNLSENGTDNMPTSLINPESVFYHEETQMIYFEHSCGVSSGVIVKEHKPYSNMLASNSMNNSVLSSTTSYGNENDINSVIMFGWDNPTNNDDSTYGLYDDLSKKISHYGVYSTIYTHPTVSDYKTAFLNMDLIFIAEHGVNYFDESEQQTYCCFAAYGDTVSEDKYPFDISQKNIYKVYDATINDDPKRDLYIISPKFFEYYYGNNKLKNSVVVVGSCEGFGNGGKENYSLAKALHDVCGSAVVVGFHNSVFIAYSLAISESFSTNMLCGYTASEAIQMSIETHCKDDIKYMYNEYAPSHTEWWTTPDTDKDGLTGKSQTDKKYADSGAAYPCIYGELNYRIPNTCGTFSAWVENRSTGTPIEGVEVSIYLESEKDKSDKNIYTYTTNENGAIKATLPVGDYIADFTYGEQKAQTTFTIEKDVNYILQNPVYLDENNENLVTFNVTDNNGNALQNVTVSTLNKGTNQTNSVIGNSGLSLTLSAGTYEITVSKDGYQSVTQTITQSDGAINRVLNITLTATDESDTPTDEPEDDTSEYGTLTETGSCGDNAFYDFYEETGTLVIRGTGEMTNWRSELYVPWYDKCSIIKTVIISKGITSIGSYAFSGAYYTFTSIALPNGVTSIGECAFVECNGLVNITLPESLISIGERAFQSCDSLIDITIPDSVTSIGNYAFEYCTSLTSVAIPNGITSIGHGAFNSCDSLTSITIPDSVTSIGNSAFSNCGFTNITIPDSVTSIGDYAFNGCNSLTSITISDSITIIGNYVFEYCTSLTSVAIPDGVTSIGDYAFYRCDSLTSIALPDGMTSIGRRAFEECYSLTSITIPDSVTSIGDGAFEGCDSLASVTIPDSVTTIGNCAFGYCTSLTSVAIPDSVTYIGYRAFEKCDSLTSIAIPDNVTSIGEATFHNCDSLTNVIIGKGVTSISDNAFYSCDSLTNITVDSVNTAYSNDEYGILFNKNQTELILYPSGNTRTSYKIPNSATSISDNAFYSCDSLTSVDIPNSVINIGEYAFAYCENLTSITIPDSVTSIGSQAFEYCSALTEVTIGNNVTNINRGTFFHCSKLTTVSIGKSVTTIGDSVFEYCTSLINITIPNNVTSIGDNAFSNCDGLTRVTIGKNVTSIGDKAFYHCDNLKSVIMPNSVTYIGDYAFAGQPAFSGDVYYTGTETEWKAIKIGRYALSYATIYYNS